MTDLLEFLRARLDKDEHLARAAGESRIAWLTYRDDEGQMRYTTVAAEAGDSAWIAEGSELPVPASVLVVYDPARVLREVETKRQLVKLHEPVILHDGGGAAYYETTRVCRSCEPPKQFPETAYPCVTLRLLALPYSDHPNYCEEWRP